MGQRAVWVSWVSVPKTLHAPDNAVARVANAFDSIRTEAASLDSAQQPAKSSSIQLASSIDDRVAKSFGDGQARVFQKFARRECTIAKRCNLLQQRCHGFVRLRSLPLRCEVCTQAAHFLKERGEQCAGVRVACHL